MYMACFAKLKLNQNQLKQSTMLLFVMINNKNSKQLVCNQTGYITHPFVLDCCLKVFIYLFFNSFFVVINSLTHFCQYCAYVN